MPQKKCFALAVAALLWEIVPVHAQDPAQIAVKALIDSVLVFPSPVAAVDSGQEAKAQKAIEKQYTRYDKAFTARNETFFVRAVGNLYAPKFSAADTEGKPILREAWLKSLVERATLSLPRRPSRTSFKVVENESVTYTTHVGELTLRGDDMAIVESRQSVSTNTTGRFAPDAPRQRIGSVMTFTQRDEWVKTADGWKIQRVTLLQATGMSSIAHLDPSGS